MDPPFISGRALAVGWYMGWRLLATGLVAGGALAALALGASSGLQIASPTLTLWYCVLGTATVGCLATNYFAGRWVEREYDRALPAGIWWGVAWRTGLIALLSAGLVLSSFAAHPVIDVWARILAAISATAGLLGTLLMLGWSTARLAHRSLKDGAPERREDPHEEIDEVDEAARALHVFREEGQTVEAARRPRPTRVECPDPPKPRGAEQRGAPLRDDGPSPQHPRQPAGSSPQSAARSSASEPGPPAPDPPGRFERPRRIPEGMFQGRVWQNVVGGWEVEISYGPGGTEGVPGKGCVVFRTDRKPRPLGAPPGGFHSREMAEAFAKAKVEEGLELLKLNERWRRAPRYSIPGGIPGTMDSAGPAQVQDLSLLGACAECQVPLTPGQEIHLAVNLPGGRLRTSAQVVWSAPVLAKLPGDSTPPHFRSGLRFVSLPPEDMVTLQAYLGSG